jgi:hypothetical protein
MSTEQSVMAMSEGIPGAVRVCVDLLIFDIPSGFHAFMLLDTFEIYGQRIYFLCDQVCRGDLQKMIALLRATQMMLAGMSQQRLHDAIDNKGESIDLDSIEVAVKALD